MSNHEIHPTAIIEEGAQIGENVTIEPHAIIKKNVTLCDGVTIKAHCYLDGYTTIGENTIIYPFVSIGTKPQDLKFRGERTFVNIGKNCQIREFVTINSSCGENTAVNIGDNCLIMAYCHIAHNCEVGNHVIMSNNATLAGHVVIEDFAIIGGMTPIHQRTRIGRFSMVGGFSRLPYSMPPFTIGGGVPFKLAGINVVGLKRHGFSLPVRKILSQVFKITFRMNLPLKDSLKKIEDEVEPIPEVIHWINFCRTSERGVVGIQGITLKKNDASEEMKSEEKEKAFASIEI